MIFNIKKSDKRVGASPGTLEYHHEIKSEKITLNLINYDNDNYTVRKIDMIE